MARKKKSIKKRSSSRSMKLEPMTIAANIAGAIAAQVVVSKLPIKNDLIKSAAPIAIGIFLSGNKNKMIASIGNGMAAVGGANLVKVIVPGIAGLTGENDTYIAADDFPTLDGASGGVLDGAAGDTLTGEYSPYATINGPNDSYIAGDDNMEILA